MRLIGSIHIYNCTSYASPVNDSRKGYNGAELKAHASNSYNVLTRLIHIQLYELRLPRQRLSKRVQWGLNSKRTLQILTTRLNSFNTYTIIRVTSPPSTTLKKGTMRAELKTHASNSYNASKLV